MKNLLLIAFLILTNISFSQTWTLQGKTSSKLFKKGTGIYELKYKSEYGESIFTLNLTRTSKKEDKVYAHFGGDPLLATFGILASKEEREKAEPVVPAVIEICKSNDPDYKYLIFWANVKYGPFPYYNAIGYIIETSVLGDITNIWFIL